MNLTPAEKDVLSLVADGKANRDIAVIRNTSANTVRAQLQSILEKLEAENRSHAVAIALRERLI